MKRWLCVLYVAVYSRAIEFCVSSYPVTLMLPIPEVHILQHLS
uniref:Uncharacterized protein n=1 Tax=Arundo donax TaxID=35708 RepID=A0A0A9ANS2_ARUDO